MSKQKKDYDSGKGVFTFLYPPKSKKYFAQVKYYLTKHEWDHRHMSKEELKGKKLKQHLLKQGRKAADRKLKPNPLYLDTQEARPPRGMPGSPAPSGLATERAPQVWVRKANNKCKQKMQKPPM